MNVICATGVYRWVPMPYSAWDEDGAAAYMLREINDGIAGTSIRPGMIKLAWDIEYQLEPLRIQMEKMARGAARAAKAAGLPIWRMLGGSPMTTMPAYASLLRYGKADMVAENSARAVSQGYRDIKLHEITVPEIVASRDAIGPDVRLMCDTNCPWTIRASSRRRKPPARTFPCASILVRE